jgi:hypothetical protein
MDFVTACIFVNFVSTVFGGNSILERVNGWLKSGWTY